MEYIFYFVGLLCGYSYFLYPLVLKFIPARKNWVAIEMRDMAYPALSLIITVHNEEERIHEKLENTLLIDYPKDLLEIIVASDCSSDSTDSIVGSFRDKGVRLVRADEHKGKEYAQLCAIREAGGDILVFSDVATRIPADALRILALQFEDPRIGALSSEDRFISNDGRVAGEGAYVKYEMWLRRLESGQGGSGWLERFFFRSPTRSMRGVGYLFTQRLQYGT